MSILDKVDFDIEENAIDTKQYLMMYLEGQLFGILVDDVEDVLSPQAITPIPLAPDEVKGILNLRGRIVTAINLRARLGMGDADKQVENYRSVVVQREHDLYSFIFDKVSEVVTVAESDIERVPDNMTEGWKDVCNGVHSFEDEVMVILDTEKLLGINDNENDEEAESDND